MMTVSGEHESEITAGLTRAERTKLIELLGKVAANQGLAEGVHPALREDPQ